jgi:hypothetical protein
VHVTGRISAMLRLDGSRAAANTVIRKRAVLHGALGYAAEAGLLPDNPLDTIAWQVPRSSAALDPMVVASPAQVSALLGAVARTPPEMTAFFGCLYYAALRPEEADHRAHGEVRLVSRRRLRLQPAGTRAVQSPPKLTVSSPGSADESDTRRLNETTDLVSLMRPALA